MTPGAVRRRLACREPPTTLVRRPSAATLWLPLTVLLAVPLALPPNALPELPLCLFKALTGLRCPGCGLTHAFLAAGRGQWWAAALHHPLGPALHTGIVSLWGAIGIRWLACRTPWLRRGPS